MRAELLSLQLIQSGRQLCDIFLASGRGMRTLDTSRKHSIASAGQLPGDFKSMTKKKETASAVRRGGSKLVSDLKHAEARWREEKHKARDAKAAAKDAKKTVKRLRKLVLEEKEKLERRRSAASSRRASKSSVKPARGVATEAAPKKVRIAGTPEGRRKITKKRRTPTPPQSAPVEQTSMTPADQPADPNPPGSGSGTGSN